MRVKIGDKWYDSKDEPICIHVSELEQDKIGSMNRTVIAQGKYGSFPENLKATAEQRLKWMNDDCMMHDLRFEYL